MDKVIVQWRRRLRILVQRAYDVRTDNFDVSVELIQLHGPLAAVFSVLSVMISVD